MLWYTPTLDQDCPPWVYASWAIGLFLYQTFDAVDGSQARRTHQSGPLGELFDHGVDAVNTTLEVLLFSATMNFGQGWRTVLNLFACKPLKTLEHRMRRVVTNTSAALLTFYVQTWDEYHTHTLTLGVISGPVEGIVTLCIIYAFTAYLGGGSFWQRSMLQTLGLKQYDFIPSVVYNLAWNDWYMVYGSAVLVFNTVLRYVLEQSHLDWTILIISKCAERNEGTPCSWPTSTRCSTRPSHIRCGLGAHPCVPVSAAYDPAQPSGSVHLLRRPHQRILGRTYDYLASHQVSLPTG
jgi:phosphatidylglycerophosphate synthase